MSDRGRGGYHTVVSAVFVAVIALLAGALIYEMAASHTERQIRAEHNTARYAQSAEDHIRYRCIILPTPAEVAECAAKEAKAAEDARRDEYDLSAQQDMGDSAAWMVWVSVASITITAAGAFLVWLSLRQTRQAISNDREIGHAQVKAYVGAAGAGVTLATDETKFSGVVLLKNFGQSPASRLRFIFNIRILESGDVIPVPHPEKDTETSERVLGSGDTAEVSVGRAFVGTELLDIREKRKAFFVRGWVTYLDVFKQERRVDISLWNNGMEYRIGKDEATKGWGLKPTPYGNDAT